MRLREMLQLSRQVKEAASGNLNMDWLKPFSSKRRMQAGEVLFNKGETADRMFIIVSGRCRLAESGVDLAPGAVVGELALLSPDKTRTQTMQCTESGGLLEITYGQVRQLYFQNPTFGFYFLELASKRLFENIGRLEAEVARLRAHSIQQGEASTTA
jgi:CRP/FNR family cyclic AMP-dependent transcriptional regulator